uniref:Uncharacterized protein n=1 Tax=Romanomermis culicivorax TaxID=13658 RepID=A0A915HW25_ROMCU
MKLFFRPIPSFFGRSFDNMFVDSTTTNETIHENRFILTDSVAPILSLQITLRILRLPHFFVPVDVLYPLKYFWRESSEFAKPVGHGRQRSNNQERSGYFFSPIQTVDLIIAERTTGEIPHIAFENYIIRRQSESSGSKSSKTTGEKCH